MTLDDNAAGDALSVFQSLLFILDSDAGVRPKGAHAARLILDGHSHHGGHDAATLTAGDTITGFNARVDGKLLYDSRLQ